ELEERTRSHLKPTNKSWRVDETYVRVKGCWFYLYRALDLPGAAIDFFLSAFRSADAAKALFAKALADPSHPQPRWSTRTKAHVLHQRSMNARKNGSYEGAAATGWFNI